MCLRRIAFWGSLGLVILSGYSGLRIHQAGSPLVHAAATPPAAEPVWTPVVNTEDFPLPVVYVPAGCFMMGSETQHYEDAKLVHEVCLSAFWIGQTEVTNAQYEECVDAGVCEPPSLASHFDCPDWTDPNRAEHPVVCVTWAQAQTYSEWVGGSLPTEAQWEYAARSPEGYTYPWGNQPPTCDLLNFHPESGYCMHDTTPVGSYPRGASWVGALDMAGNVWEFTADWYGESYYSTLEPGAIDPRGPAQGNSHTARGGCFMDNQFFVHSAIRYDLGIYSFNYVFGLRVAFPLSGSR